MKNKNTCELFKEFYGTENYWKYDNHFAYTDGMKYLKDNSSKDFFNCVIETIIENNSYRNPFLAAELIINEDNSAKLVVTDGDYNKLETIMITSYEHNLAQGVYKMFCYNFVVMAASEY